MNFGDERGEEISKKYGASFASAEVLTTPLLRGASVDGFLDLLINCQHAPVLIELYLIVFIKDGIKSDSETLNK